MWAASPARNRRPKRIGSVTELRSGATLFSIEGPVTRASRAAGSSRARSSSQNASSLQRATSVSAGTCT